MLCVGGVGVCVVSCVVGAGVSVVPCVGGVGGSVVSCVVGAGVCVVGVTANSIIIQCKKCKCYYPSCMYILI